jgi:hypothetical protein
LDLLPSSSTPIINESGSGLIQSKKSSNRFLAGRLRVKWSYLSRKTVNVFWLNTKWVIPPGKSQQSAIN